MTKHKLITLPLVALLLLSLTACNTKTIAAYTADAGDATKSFLDASKAMFDSHAISKATYSKLLDAAETANRDTDAFKSTAVQLGVVTADNKKPLEDKINDALIVIRNVGNVQISDPAQKAKFDSIIGAIQIAYTGILASLANIKKATAVSPKIVAQVQRTIDAVGAQIDRQRKDVDYAY